MYPIWSFFKCPKHLQTQMEKYCEKFRAAYLDDVIVFSDNWSDHLSRLGTCVCTVIRTCAVRYKSLFIGLCYMLF